MTVTDHAPDYVVPVPQNEGRSESLRQPMVAEPPRCKVMVLPLCDTTLPFGVTDVNNWDPYRKYVNLDQTV